MLARIEHRGIRSRGRTAGRHELDDPAVFRHDPALGAAGEDGRADP